MSVDTSRDQVDRLAHYAAMLGIPLGDEHAALRDHHETVAATLRALLAERDAAYAAGQREMRGRAVSATVRVESDHPAWVNAGSWACAAELCGIRINDLPIKDKPDGG